MNSLKLILLTLLISIGLAYSPVNINANSNVKAILNYFEYLTNNQKTIIGQFAYTQALSNYSAFGKWNGLLEMNLGWEGTLTLIEPNRQQLLDYWNDGGIISIHLPWPQNPFYAQTDFTNCWLQGGTNCQHRTGKPSTAKWSDMFDPTKTANKNLTNSLHKLSEHLKWLETNGATTLLRLYHENNGHWFWWGSYSNSMTNTEYKQLFKYTVDYLTQTEGLNNIIFCWSPSGEDTTDIMQFYPGDDATDLVSLDVYESDPNIRKTAATYYTNLIKQTSKIFVFGEKGTVRGQETNGTSCYSNYLLEQFQKTPQCAYMSIWASDARGARAPFTLLQGRELFDDPRVITRDEISYTNFYELPPVDFSNYVSIADTFVRGGVYASSSYGTWTKIDVMSSTDVNYSRLSYLKFNLSNVSLSQTPLATLRLYCSDSINPDNDISVYEVFNDTWNESTLTWNNKPALGQWIDMNTIVTSNYWYDFDITRFVNLKLADNKIVTVALSNETIFNLVKFYSKNNGVNIPYIEIKNGSGYMRIQNKGAYQTGLSNIWIKANNPPNVVATNFNGNWTLWKKVFITTNEYYLQMDDVSTNIRLKGNTSSEVVRATTSDTSDYCKWIEKYEMGYYYLDCKGVSGNARLYYDAPANNLKLTSTTSTSDFSQWWLLVE